MAGDVALAPAQTFAWHLLLCKSRCSRPAHRETGRGGSPACPKEKKSGIGFNATSMFGTLCELCVFCGLCVEAFQVQESDAEDTKRTEEIQNGGFPDRRFS